MKPLRLLFACSFAVVVAVASAQNRVRDTYTKYEYMIPMRDGVKLYTQVYVPKDNSAKHPILMERTCYNAGPYGPDAYPGGFRGSVKLREKGYIFAYQDVRGKYHSEGDYVNVRPQLKPGQKGIDESTDTWDTVDYLVKNVPNNNGAVGLWGISYPGFYAGVGGINTHPALKAISPQAPVSDWFLGDDVHHNGAFFQQDTFDFALFFDAPRGQEPVRIDREGKSAYDFYLGLGSLANWDAKLLKGKLPYWYELMDNGTYNDYWKDRALPQQMKNVKCACLFVGGMFDAEDMWGALYNYAHTERQNRGIQNFLVMGPWFHGMWAGGTGQTFGDIDFGSQTSTFYRDEIEFPFFEKYLRGQNIPAPAEATIFETGANQWRKFAQWPPKGLRDFDLFFTGNKGLSTTKPSDTGSESYDYDPAAPTPYIADYKDSKRRPREYMIADQRFAAARPDVIAYQTAPLPADQRVVGPVDADLWITTTGTDLDLVVKIIDVWPDDAQEKSPKGDSIAGYQQLIRGDIFRGKFRNSFEKPEPFKPGEPTRVKFKLNEMLHTFKKGHRIMVQVQSAWFPLVDRNPNQFVDIYKAKDTDFIKATITLLRDPKHPSAIKFKTQ